MNVEVRFLIRSARQIACYLDLKCIRSFADINECLSNNACGSNALCINTVGNYTCECLEGFVGNPYDGVSRAIDLEQSGKFARVSLHDYNRPSLQCVDVNECRSNPCGSGAKCVNQIGGYVCQCPPGSDGDPYSSGCIAGSRVPPRGSYDDNFNSTADRFYMIFVSRLEWVLDEPVRSERRLQKHDRRFCVQLSGGIHWRPIQSMHR